MVPGEICESCEETARHGPFLFPHRCVLHIMAATTARRGAKMQSIQQPTRGAACGDETIHRFHVESADVGALGFVDGGKLLEWIDEAAYATAAQWCGRCCVTASVGNVHLDRPISVGELVEVQASLVYTGCCSMHILVTICSSDLSQAYLVQTSQCSIVFVAVDESGYPVEVPRWTPVTMLELQRQRQARVRIRTRRRIEAAMAAESYTAKGTAPRATLRFVADNQIDGGRVMRWIDEAAYACGADWIGFQVITSYVAGMCFYRPIIIGDVIEVAARIIHTGPRSVHISVGVTKADATLVAHGLTVVVALDERGRAKPVPQWQPASGEDHRLDQHARHLIELRKLLEPFTTAIAFHKAG
jgi:acyl-CoA hydrolase